MELSRLNRACVIPDYTDGGIIVLLRAALQSCIGLTKYFFTVVSHPNVSSVSHGTGRYNVTQKQHLSPPPYSVLLEYLR